MTPDGIKQLIASSLPCIHLEITGEDGQHFYALIVSEVFEGKRLVERHRLVKDSIKTQLNRNEIHAFSMKTLTPAEWQTRQNH